MTNTKLPYCIDANGNLTVVLEGRTYTVAKGLPHYDEVLKLVREGKTADLGIRLANRPLKRGKAEYRDGVVYLDGTPVDKGFSDRISSLILKGKKVDGWLKFIERVRQNIEPFVRENLERFVANRCLSVTDEGEILGYKSVTQAFKDHHTNTFLYEVGKVYTMSHEKVCADPRNECAAGLHFGSMEYIEDNYANSPIYLVKVNPEDVISVPFGSNSKKCRCCRFEVVRLLTEDEVENHGVFLENVEVPVIEVPGPEVEVEVPDLVVNDTINSGDDEVDDENYWSEDYYDEDDSDIEDEVDD